MVWHGAAAVQRAVLLLAAGAVTTIGVGALPVHPLVGQKLIDTETAVTKKQNTHSNKRKLARKASESLTTWNE